MMCRSMGDENMPWVLVDPRHTIAQHNQALLWKLKEGDATFSCRVFLADLGDGLHASLIFE